MTITVERHDVYSKVTIDLSIEHTNKEIYCPGDVISVVYLDGNVTIRLDEPDAPEIDLSLANRIDLRPKTFRYLYVTNAAQSGKKAVLLIGREASFTAQPYLSKFDLKYVNGEEQTAADWTTYFDDIPSINDKLRSPVDDVFVKDVSVGTTAVQLDADTQVREEITLLADEGNTDVIKIGSENNQLFPLKAGASLTLRKCSLSKVYAVAASGTQTLHVICGGI